MLAREWRVFCASWWREMRLRLRRPSELMQPLAFSVLVALLMALAVGPDTNALKLIGPAALFVAILLSAFLSLDRLFAGDLADGSLDALLASSAPLSFVLYGKALGFWLCQGLSLLLALPVLMILLKLGTGLAGVLLAVLLPSSLCLCLLGLAAAALTVRLTQGAMLTLLLVMPLAVPVLIFGCGAIQAQAQGENPRDALIFLYALSIGYFTLTPPAAALALRMSSD